MNHFPNNRMRALGKPANDRFFCMLLMVLPISYLWQLQSMGTVIVMELLVGVVGLFFLVGQLLNNKEPLLRKLIGLALVWLLFQFCTDIYRGSESADYLRGWARIIFFITNIAFFSRILGHRIERLHWYVLGTAVAGFVGAIRYNGLEINAFTWKTGWMVPFTYGLVWMACRFPSWILTSGLLLTASVLSVYFQARSLAGICFASAVFYLASEFWGTRLSGKIQWGWQAKMVITAGALAALILAVSAFGYVSRQGYLGKNIYEKAEMQNARAERFLGDSDWAPLVAPLVGGRVEIMVSTKAIADSPFLGHGSWAKDFSYIEYMAVISGYTFDQIRAQSPEAGAVGLIPAHSHLFGAWVDGGLGGAIFWAVVLALCIDTLFKLFFIKIPNKVFMVFLMLNSIWDILFSPFDTGRRLLMAVVVVVIAIVPLYVKKQSLMVMPVLGRTPTR